MARVGTPRRSYLRPATLAVLCLAIAGCRGVGKTEGERLARARCATCHEFPDPSLLDRKTWQDGVLPQMALRLRVPREKASFLEGPGNPYMLVLTDSTSKEDWQKIVDYYLTHAPATLPPQ